MKKQFILPALIVSLSLSHATFASDPQKISDARALRDDLLKIAAEYDFRPITWNQELLRHKKQNCQTECMIENILIGAATITIAATGYVCLTKRFDTLFEKRMLTTLTSGLGLASYGLFNANKEMQSENIKECEQEKDRILETALPDLNSILNAKIAEYVYHTQPLSEKAKNELFKETVTPPDIKAAIQSTIKIDTYLKNFNTKTNKQVYYEKVKKQHCTSSPDKGTIIAHIFGLVRALAWVRNIFLT